MTSATISALAMALAALVCWQLAPVAWQAVWYGTRRTLSRDALIFSGAFLWLAALVGSTIRFVGLVIPEWSPPGWITDGVMIGVIIASLALILARRAVLWR